MSFLYILIFRIGFRASFVASQWSPQGPWLHDKWRKSCWLAQLRHGTRVRVMGHLWGTLDSMIQAVYNLYIYGTSDSLETVILMLST